MIGIGSGRSLQVVPLVNNTGELPAHPAPVLVVAVAEGVIPDASGKNASAVSIDPPWQNENSLGDDSNSSALVSVGRRFAQPVLLSRYHQVRAAHGL